MDKEVSILEAVTDKKREHHSHPTDILNDFDIIQGGLLELQELGRLLLNC